MSKYVFGLNNMSKLRDFAKAVKNISKLEKGKEITIIGTVTKYDFKTKSKAGKIYISDCPECFIWKKGTLYFYGEPADFKMFIENIEYAKFRIGDDK